LRRLRGTPESAIGISFIRRRAGSSAAFGSSITVETQMTALARKIVIDTATTEFATDVIAGLTATPKRLSP